MLRAIARRTKTMTEKPGLKMYRVLKHRYLHRWFILLFVTFAVKPYNNYRKNRFLGIELFRRHVYIDLKAKSDYKYMEKVSKK